MAGLGSGHPLAGGLAGIGAGLAAVGLVSLFTRGADVNIESRDPGGNGAAEATDSGRGEPGRWIGAGALRAMVPAAEQPRPMEKPNPRTFFARPEASGCQ